MVRWITALAALIGLVGWGYFAVTTVLPNPDDSAGVYGAFQGNIPFHWQDAYHLPPGSTVTFVFHLTYAPNGAGLCSGSIPSPPAKKGTFIASCDLPRPNSTLTSMIGDYLSVNAQPDQGCCHGQPPFEWVSGPTGNLTRSLSINSGPWSLFKLDQDGNYSVHISNTNFQSYPAVPPEYLNETLSFSDGYVLYSRPYFTVGVATLVVAAATAAFALYSFSRQRRFRTLSRDQDSGRKLREKPVPPGMSD